MRGAADTAAVGELIAKVGRSKNNRVDHLFLVASLEFRTAHQTLSVITDGKDSISLTVSMGYAVGGTDHEFDARTMVRHADQALYKAKEAGRNMVCRV